MSRNTKNKNYYHRILSSIVSFLRDSGLGADEIRRAVDDELLCAKKTSKPLRASVKGLGGNVDTIYAVVLHRWHRETALLSKDASPRPMRLLGKYPSVEALIAVEKPESSARKIALSMKSVGLVERNGKGKYVPKSRIATVSAIHPVLVEHVSKSLVRFLDTVRQNTSGNKGIPTLIERFTHIPDMRAIDVKDFRAFAQLHGSAFLASVDDWLEGRRVRRATKGERPKRGISAGVHVFAYIEDEKSKPKSTPRAKRA